MLEETSVYIDEPYVVHGTVDFVTEKLQFEKGK
jgi:hypothetical protein